MAFPARRIVVEQRGEVVTIGPSSRTLRGSERTSEEALHEPQILAPRIGRRGFGLGSMIPSSTL